MSIYKRNKTFWISFTTPSGQRIRRSAGTRNRRQAEELHDTLKAKSWKAYKLGEKPEKAWIEAVTRYIKRTKDKASHSRDLIYLRWLDKYLRDLLLSEIDSDLIDDLTDARLNEGVSNATVNRMLACLRAILRLAKYKWKWIDEIPEVPLLPEPTHRERWLTKEEATKLIIELPDHQSVAVHFAVLTGLRQGNIISLSWSQIDLERKKCWVPSYQSKNGKGIGVPLNDDAVEVLKSQQGKHPTRVFTYRGKPIKQLTTRAWYKTLDKLNIKDFRWHDLRHTWASWHVQNGTPLHVLQELGGWKSAEMVKRYAHLGPDHLAKYAKNSGKLK